jgi:hypothetical protein
MNDKEILKDREAKYGKPPEFFKAYGAMCEILDRYASVGQGEANYAHLSALKLVLLKVLRAGFNPEHMDSYADMRNYVSIAEMCVKKDNENNG